MHHLTTKWFEPVAALQPLACMPSKRLRFGNTRNPPAHGSTLIAIAVDEARFHAAFHTFGPIWRVGCLAES